MGTVTAILGLCGSGKTWLANQLEASGALNLDELTTGRSAAPGATGYQPLLDAVTDGRDCVISEIAYYLPQQRAVLLAALVAANPSAIVRWVCFEFDLEAANHNCRNDPTRQDVDGNLAQNRGTMLAYRDGAISIPEGAEVRPIHRVR